MGKLERVVKYGLFAVLLAPLIYTKSTVYPFVFGKAIFFQIVTEITFFLWLVLFLNNRKRFQPQFGILGKVVFLFLGILVLSAVFGADFSRSWWSTAERADGVFFLLHCGAFFLMLTSVFKQRADWLWFLRAAIGVGGLVSVYGLAQRFFPEWEFLVPSGRRTQATLGNPSFLAGYLVFIIFLSLVLIYYDRKKQPKPHFDQWFKKTLSFLSNYRWSLFYGFSLLVAISALYFTGTRGAIMGAIFGLLLFLILVAVCQQGFWKKGLIFLLVALILGLAGGVYFFHGFPLVKESLTLRRFLHIGGGSTQIRLLSWKMALEGLSARPILGQGWSNWYILFDRYFKPQHLTYTEDWMDKPHNMPLEILVTTGILGLLAYLAIFYSALKKLWRWGPSKLKIHSAGLIALLVAYFVQNLFIFDTPVSWIMFFLVLAFVQSQIIAEDYAGQSPPLRALPRRKSVFLQPRNWKFSLLGNDKRFTSYFILPTSYFLLIFIPFSFYFYNLKPLWAAREMKQAVAYSQGTEFNPEGVYNHYKAAFKKETFINYNATIELGNFIMKKFPQVGVEGLAPFIDLEISELKTQVKKHPYNLKLKLLLARMYNYKAYRKESYVAKAGEILDKAQELAPKRPEVWFEKGFVNLKQKKFDKALEYYRKGVDLNPTSGDSWWQLAVAYHQAAKNKKAAQAFAKAVKKGFAWNKKSHLLTIVNIFAKLEDYQKVAKYYKYLVKKAPKSAQYRISYALALAKIKSYKKAIKQMKKAIKLDPEVAKQGGQDYIEQWEAQ